MEVLYEDKQELSFISQNYQTQNQPQIKDPTIIKVFVQNYIKQQIPQWAGFILLCKQLAVKTKDQNLRQLCQKYVTFAEQNNDPYDILKQQNVVKCLNDQLINEQLEMERLMEQLKTVQMNRIILQEQSEKLTKIKENLLEGNQLNQIELQQALTKQKKQVEVGRQQRDQKYKQLINVYQKDGCFASESNLLNDFQASINKFNQVYTSYLHQKESLRVTEQQIQYTQQNIQKQRRRISQQKQVIANLREQNLQNQEVRIAQTQRTNQRTYRKNNQMRRNIIKTHDKYKWLDHALILWAFILIIWLLVSILPNPQHNYSAIPEKETIIQGYVYPTKTY